MKNIVIVIIRNNQKKYFVHQRINDKRTTFHGLYGLGIGGGVKPYETIFTAAKRELKEEAGLSDEPKFLFSMNMNYIGLKKVAHVHELIHDGEIKNCDEEWQWSGWMTQSEVDKLLDEGKLCPDTAEFYKEYKRLKEKE